MDIRDVLIGEMVEQWFGRRGPDEAMPDSFSWLPQSIQKRYSDVSPLLWGKGCVWQVKKPAPAASHPGKMVFISGDEGEWKWAYDTENPDHLFDLGPDEKEWSEVDVELADLLAQRGLLEIAYSVASHRALSSIPRELLPEVVSGLTEITVRPWRALPELRLHLGDGVVAVSNLDTWGGASSGGAGDALDIRVAATDRSKLEYLSNREWPHRWRFLSAVPLERIRDYERSRS